MTYLVLLLKVDWLILKRLHEERCSMLILLNRSVMLWIVSMKWITVRWNNFDNLWGTSLPMYFVCLSLSLYTHCKEKHKPGFAAELSLTLLSPEQIRVSSSKVRTGLLPTYIAHYKGSTYIYSTLSGSISISSTLSGNIYIYSTLSDRTYIYSTLSGSTYIYSTLSGSTHISSTLSGRTYIYSTLSGSIYISSTLSGSTYIYSTLSGGTYIYSTL